MESTNGFQALLSGDSAGNMGSRTMTHPEDGQSTKLECKGLKLL